MKCNKTFGICSQGFTLVEIMVVVAIISILAFFATPELVDWGPKMRLKAAGDDLVGNMQRAKVHAIKNNVNVVFTFTPPATCPGGTYSFVDSSAAAVVVAAADLTSSQYTGTCLAANTFTVGQGYDSRGLRLIAGGTESITVTHERLTDSGDPTYQVSMTSGGGIQLNKVLIP